MKTVLIIMAVLLAAPCWAVEVKDADGVPSSNLIMVLPSSTATFVNTTEIEEALVLEVGARGEASRYA